MKVYFVRDSDPLGGFFAVAEPPPVVSEEKRTIIEVRKGDFPKKLLDSIYRGELEPDPQYFYDEYIIPYWDQAEVWWTRDEGYVVPKGGKK